MKKTIITLTILFLTINGIEAGKGGSIAGGILGYTVARNITRAAGSSSRGNSYYKKKIRAKERRNKKAQEALNKDKEKLEYLKRKLAVREGKLSK